MFERYTENSRLAIFRAREEAAETGSRYIESEYLLLGIIRSCEPEIEAVFNLKLLEASLRAALAANLRPESPDTSSDKPLSNACKRILAYSAEEAERLGSWEIHSGHLLLGILREHENMAAGFLSSNSIDLLTARQRIRNLAPRDSEESHRPPTQWSMAGQHSYTIGTAVEVVALVLLVIGVSASATSGRHLLIIAAGWFGGGVAWLAIGRRSLFFVFGRVNRAASIVSAYGFFLLSQLLLFGWIVPLAVGIYRLATRK